MKNQWTDSGEICPTCAFPVQTYNGLSRRCACRRTVTPFRQAAIDAHQEWYDYGIHCSHCGAIIQKHIITGESRCHCAPSTDANTLAVEEWLRGPD